MAVQSKYPHLEKNQPSSSESKQQGESVKLQ